MKKLLSILSFALVACIPFLTSAQTAPPPPNNSSFFSSVTGYFSSFDTNNDTTFSANKGSVWTGVDSIQGGTTTLANALGIDYKLFGPVAVESVTRNSGIAGTLVSENIGFHLSFVVHDTELQLYASGGYDMETAVRKTGDRLFGEFGLRVRKALTTHTYAGVGIGAQVPANRQVFQAFAGFVF
jgi:hypothetical protein